MLYVLCISSREISDNYISREVSQFGWLRYFSTLCLFVSQCAYMPLGYDVVVQVFAFSNQKHFADTHSNQDRRGGGLKIVIEIAI